MKIQVSMAFSSLHSTREVVRRTALTLIGDSKGYKGGYNPEPTSHCHTRSALFIREHKDAAKKHILVLVGDPRSDIVAHSYILDDKGVKVSDTFRGTHSRTTYNIGDRPKFGVVASFHVGDILHLARNMLDFDNIYPKITHNALGI